MVYPRRNDIAIINAMKRNKQGKKEPIGYNEESEYKNLLWDKEHGQLPILKQDRFEELKEKYGNKPNL